MWNKGCRTKTTQSTKHRVTEFNELHSYKAFLEQWDTPPCKQFFTGSIRSNYSLTVLLVSLQQQHLVGLFLLHPTDQELPPPIDFHWAAWWAAAWAPASGAAVGPLRPTRSPRPASVWSGRPVRQRLASKQRQMSKRWLQMLSFITQLTSLLTTAFTVSRTKHGKKEEKELLFLEFKWLFAQCELLWRRVFRYQSAAGSQKERQWEACTWPSGPSE